MDEPRGMLTADQPSVAVADERIDTVIVAFTDHYGRQMGKRIDASFFLDEVASSGTHACDYLLTVDMEMEPVEGYDFADWQLGYGDVHLGPDLSTLRVASWLDRTASVICDVLDPRTHERVNGSRWHPLRRYVASWSSRASSTTGSWVPPNWSTSGSPVPMRPPWPTGTWSSSTARRTRPSPRAEP